MKKGSVISWNGHYFILISIVLSLNACVGGNMNLIGDGTRTMSPEPSSTLEPSSTFEPTPSPTITQTPSPTFTNTPAMIPTAPPISAAVCDDVELGYLGAFGVPEEPSRLPLSPGGGFLKYDPENYSVHTKNIHHRDVTIAIEKGFYSPIGGVQIVDFVFDTWAYYWNIFGGFPFPSYTIVVGRDLPFVRFSAFGGGIEIDNPNLLENKVFIAHEMFHAWHGCTGAFGQYPQVWFQEGVTSYYGARQGGNFINEITTAYETYLVRLEEGEEIPLSKIVQSHGLTILDQYNKGFLIAYMMDVKLKETGHNLDEVMHALYQEFGIEKTGNPTDQDLIRILNDISGSDFNDFFDKYVFGLEPLPILPFEFHYICHNNEPEVIPLADNIEKEFIIDGKKDDWDLIDPYILDAEGDSNSGNVGDLKFIKAKMDQHFLYVAIDAGERPDLKEWDLEIYLDTVEGGKCLDSDLVLSVWRDDFAISWEVLKCETSYSMSYEATTVWAWDEVFEAAFPLYLLQDYQHVDILGVVFHIQRDGDIWNRYADVMEKDGVDFPY